MMTRHLFLICILFSLGDSMIVLDPNGPEAEIEIATIRSEDENGNVFIAMPAVMPAIEPPTGPVKPIGSPMVEPAINPLPTVMRPENEEPEMANKNPLQEAAWNEPIVGAFPPQDPPRIMTLLPADGDNNGPVSMVGNIPKPLELEAPVMNMMQTLEESKPNPPPEIPISWRRDGNQEQEGPVMMANQMQPEVVANVVTEAATEEEPVTTVTEATTTITEAATEEATTTDGCFHLAPGSIGLVIWILILFV